ncbi:hypothetical protein BGX38DRAFT_744043 [Terfezia claveryi]|nr:hypothetical protein BGX38DRAFT_744043 [Terfezia claveryi]
MMPPIASTRSHYDVLGLSAPTRNGATPELLTSQAVKKAYHKALLKWHPDKALVGGALSATTLDKPNKSSPLPTDTPGYTLDEIITAYITLSTERGRREYEREYRLRLAGNTKEEVKGLWNSYVPMDVVDLDDFEYEERLGKFYKGCRCGENEGYVLWEGELEEVQTGEVVVGCMGCSLWLKVEFEVVAEWERKVERIDEENGEQEQGKVVEKI